MSGHYRDQLADQPLDVEILSQESVYEGFRRYNVMRLKHAALSSDATIGPMDREYLSVGKVAVIIPYDPKCDAIVVIRQFRTCAAIATPNAAALELPAGLVDPGETLESTASRELTEETGLEALAIERCFSMLPSPGLVDEQATVFLAIVDAGKLSDTAGKADEHEDIRPILAPVDQLLEAVDEGRVENGYLITCANWFARKGRARAQALQGTLFDAEEM
ncbi:NUDIX domain-containing protein [Jiella marina]|uniref:NUDIX domain-containing protein n=1 Tax=Jiella sp. LLJ827 TaxID=2917712 RepID=UPI002100A3CC|nr:NUDIX domain-containing protein [Jiella sp. LLJ827]MCQ0989046.1 NUDIX domain-containing protein [Jiella sp. LLJ827]